MKIYGLKNCDTCRKALKALPEAVLVDVRADGVPSDVLSAAHAQFEGALVNTRSTTWRQLDDSDRALPALDLIRAHPSVMKRPLISVDNQLFLGWNKEVEGALKALL